MEPGWRFMVGRCTSLSQSHRLENLGLFTVSPDLVLGTAVWYGLHLVGAVDATLIPGRTAAV